MLRMRLIILLVIVGWINSFVASEKLLLNAMCDVNFMHEMVCQNHPGMHNILDPEFEKLSHTAYQKTIIECSMVQNNQQHIDVLKKYASAFNDAHLRFCSAQLSQHNHSIETDGRTFAVNQLADKMTWITLPTFHPNDRQRTELISIIDQLPDLRSQSSIIFDVRGNTGGNSAWSDKIVEGLFGNDYAVMQKKKYEHEVAVDWRASADNVAYVKSLIEFIGHDLGTASPTYAWICGIQQGMSDAFVKGDLYFREEQLSSANIVADTQKQCAAKIIVIIDRHCASACLDFIDYLKILNHPVTLIGQTTNADSLYMEVRNIEVPSKIGHLVLPIKVYRNRPRGHNQPYHPDIAYSGDINDTKSLQSWVMKHAGLCQVFEDHFIICVG